MVNDIALDEDSAPLTALDHRRLQHVDQALKSGLALKQWWRQSAGPVRGQLDQKSLAEILQAGPDRKSFRLLDFSDRWPENLCSGFFDRAPLDGGERRVTGGVLQLFYDHPKLHAAQDVLKLGLGIDNASLEKAREKALEVWTDSVRAFAIHHLIRLCSFQLARPHVDKKRRPVARSLRPLAWCPEDDTRQQGLGYSQLYYKRRDNGRVGKFRQAVRERIDLRDIEPRQKYSWIVISLRLYDYALELKPYGNEAPQLTIPLSRENLGIISPELLVDGGPVGKENYRTRSGFGYVMLDDPDDGAEAGPRGVGFQLFRFVVQENGRIVARSVFVRDRPRGVVELPVKPFTWGLELTDLMSLGLFSPLLSPLKRVARRLPFNRGIDPFLAYSRLANLATGGLAAEELCVSKDELIKSVMADYAMSYLTMLQGTRSTWRVVPDWTKDEDLPAWARP